MKGVGMRTKAEELGRVEEYLQANVVELMKLDGPECNLTMALESANDAILSIKYRRERLERKARKTGEVQFV